MSSDSALLQVPTSTANDIPSNDCEENLCISEAALDSIFSNADMESEFHDNDDTNAIDNDDDNTINNSDQDDMLIISGDNCEGKPKDDIQIISCMPKTTSEGNSSYAKIKDILSSALGDEVKVSLPAFKDNGETRELVGTMDDLDEPIISAVNYNCPYCTKIFGSSMTLDFHKKVVHEDKESSLKNVDKYAQNQGFVGNYGTSVNRYKNKKDLLMNSTKCYICNLTFNTYNDFFLHFLLHDEEMNPLIPLRGSKCVGDVDILPCNYCGKAFNRRDLLVKHIQRMHHEELMAIDGIDDENETSPKSEQHQSSTPSSLSNNGDSKRIPIALQSTEYSIGGRKRVIVSSSSANNNSTLGSGDPKSNKMIVILKNSSNNNHDEVPTIAPAEKTVFASDLIKHRLKEKSGINDTTNQKSASFPSSSSSVSDSVSLNKVTQNKSPKTLSLKRIGGDAVAKRLRTCVSITNGNQIPSQNPVKAVSSSLSDSSRHLLMPPPRALPLRYTTSDKSNFTLVRDEVGCDKNVSKNTEEDCFFCKNCQLQFQSHKSLLNHDSKKHGKISPLVCSYCHLSFLYERCFQFHQCVFDDPK